MSASTAVVPMQATSANTVGDQKEIHFISRFALAGLSGIAGASSVYPLDLIKTRLQNQRGVVAGEAMYNGIFDCAKKTYKADGFRGLYRGLPTNVIGITPEKAIKLSVNDYLRHVLKVEEQEARGVFPWAAESVAAAAAALAQVVATNPMEVVKIRMQVQNGPGPRMSAIQVCKELGLRGLYRDSSATLLRDIPFTVIYFPLYAYLRMKLKQHKGVQTLTLPERLVTATIAGVFAASLTTPLDVVKTRLQAAQNRAAGGSHGSIVGTFTKIVREEGPRALFKGVVPRASIIAPLFGITMTTYEILQTQYLRLTS